jgi:hypothetical protein
LAKDKFRVKVKVALRNLMSRLPTFMAALTTSYRKTQNTITI